MRQSPTASPAIQHRSPVRSLLACVVPALLVSGGLWAQDAAKEPAGKSVAGGLSPSAPPRVGLSSDSTLGLPGVRLDGPFAASRRYGPLRSYWHDYRYRGLPGYHHPGYYPYDYGWAPWHGVPQTEKVKAHEPALYDRPKLGLQYVYPYPNDIGLEPLPDPDPPLAPPSAGGELPAADPSSASIVEALALMRQGQYASAGRVLAPELRRPIVSVDVYVLISEILVAAGKYSTAAKLFRHGLETAPDLETLGGVNIAEHFPSPAALAEKLKAFRDAQLAPGLKPSPEVQLLDAGLRLLSGDATAMDVLETLQEADSPVAGAARKLHHQFLDVLFDAGPPAASGAGQARKPEGRPQAGSGTSDSVRE
jgi:hypothetical protein